MVPVPKAYEPNRKGEEQSWLCSKAPGFTQAKKFLPERQMQNKKSQEKGTKYMTGRKVR